MPKVISPSTLVASIRDAMVNSIPLDADFGSTLKLNFGNQGIIYIDGKSAPIAISTDRDDEAECTVFVSANDFELMMRGELDGMQAFKGQRLRLVGDMNVAIAFGPVLQKAAA